MISELEDRKLEVNIDILKEYYDTTMDFLKLVKDAPFTEFNLPEAVKTKKLVQNDLLSVNVKGCEFKN